MMKRGGDEVEKMRKDGWATTYLKYDSEAPVLCAVIAAVQAGERETRVG